LWLVTLVIQFVVQNLVDFKVFLKHFLEDLEVDGEDEETNAGEHGEEDAVAIHGFN
jgi:hypothetical protein